MVKIRYIHHNSINLLVIFAKLTVYYSRAHAVDYHVCQLFIVLYKLYVFCL